MKTVVLLTLLSVTVPTALGAAEPATTLETKIDGPTDSSANPRMTGSQKIRGFALLSVGLLFDGPDR